MKTDKDKYIELMTGFGLKLEVNENPTSADLPDNAPPVGCIVHMGDPDKSGWGNPDKIMGYRGYHIQHYFDPDGTFLALGIWD